MKFEWDLSELTQFGNRLENLSAFNESMENATKRLSKALLKWMKEFTPVEEYDLINGWNGNKFLVIKQPDGFEVLIVNKTPYALAVNDGHMVYNQYGGPYKVKEYNPKGVFGRPEGRIQVRTPYQWQENISEWFVFGHFFVERGILRLKDTKQIEQIIMQELKKWWDSI